MCPYDKSLETFNNPRINKGAIQKKSRNIFNDICINRNAPSKKVWKHLMLLVSIKLHILKISGILFNNPRINLPTRNSLETYSIILV